MITLPEAFEQEMKQLLGEEEYEAYRKTFDEAVHRGLRVNNGKISTEEFLRRTDIPLKKVPWIPNGFYYDEESCNPAKDADYYAGLYYLQEPSAMTPASRLPIEPDDRVLDLCAAPGGKSMNVALKLTDGSVEARDLTPLKTQLIRENIARLGLDNISVKEWDARVSDTASKESADIVLADLPCSGLGIIGRKPDIKYHTDIEKIEQLASLQREILTVVQEYVKPGGTLVYSTCTISRPENEENAAWFEKNFPFIREGSAKQLLPGIDGTDGFFMVKFRKKL